MGSLFSKSNKKPPSRVTEHDKAVLQLKQQRDRLKQYQKRITISLEKDRLLAKKCIQNGRKERAKSLLRKKKYQETLLANTDKQLDNLEQLTSDLEFAQVELQVIEGLKQGNAALKKVHEVLNIDEIEKIMDETREGVEKQHEIDELLSNVLTQDEEDDVLNELNAMIAADEVPQQLPDVPTHNIVDDEAEEQVEEDDEVKTPAVKTPKKRERVEKVLVAE